VIFEADTAPGKAFDIALLVCILLSIVSGKALASLVMILGYWIIAVPTGIVTVEIAAIVRQNFKREHVLKG
jgi:hypothetical protein